MRKLINSGVNFVNLKGYKVVDLYAGDFVIGNILVKYILGSEYKNYLIAVHRLFMLQAFNSYLSVVLIIEGVTTEIHNHITKLKGLYNFSMIYTNNSEQSIASLQRLEKESTSILQSLFSWIKSDNEAIIAPPDNTQYVNQNLNLLNLFIRLRLVPVDGLSLKEYANKYGIDYFIGCKILKSLHIMQEKEIKKLLSEFNFTELIADYNRENVLSQNNKVVLKPFQYDKIVNLANQKLIL